ncbi:hypothetical protein AGMMS50262_19860 [Bacteroidia bacterium]|nr:hypothetical protein AGMMS50262_19860 [Bacteroidia bacterium]
MRIYHGSYTKIDKIDLSKCAPNKDFGRGFYVTKFRNHAENWAKVIDEKIVEQLVLDCQIDEEKAAELFYNSNTFTQLSDETTTFYLKNWTEIYELLKNELKK